MTGRRSRAVSNKGDENNSHPDESNNLGNKIVNSNTDEKENDTDGSSALNINLDLKTDEKSYHKDNVTTSVSEASGSSSRPRRKCSQVSYCPPRTPSPVSEASESSSRPRRKCSQVSYCPPRTPSPISEASGSSSRPRRKCSQMSRCPPRTPSPKSPSSSSAKKIKMQKEDISNDSNITNQRFYASSDDGSDDSSDDEFGENDEKGNDTFSALALDKLKFDIKIDPNIVDQYTDTGFTAEGSTPESPESRRQRIDIISRQCRLHPANKKYNQGPVENPPPVNGKMVGYTPAGQRHEIDLNTHRPTWFNSEYARMQWDYATRINATRMFHQLETGTFLPDELDPNIERLYIAEQEMASKLAAEQFQETASCSRSADQTLPPDSTQEDEHLQLLEVERELLDLNQYAVVRLQDFAGEIDRKLQKVLDLKLTPLMIKKNPSIIDTLETLATQCIHIEVVLSARALINKIQGLFNVPENQEFREFLAEEVEKLKEKTKDMSGIDILMMTEEPSDEESDSGDSESYTSTIDVGSSQDCWVPVENGDVWIDALSDHNYGSSEGSFVYHDDSLEDEDHYSDSDSEYSVSSSYDSEDEQINALLYEALYDDMLTRLVSGMLINGGYTLTININYFEFI